MSAQAAHATILWQGALRDALTTPQDLVAAGLMAPKRARALEATFGRFNFAIPRYYAGLFDRADLSACPLYRQAVPRPDEEDPPLPAWAQALSMRAFGRPVPWHADAIGDVAHLEVPRLTHRYAHRALLHVTAACALYCRFCFRKAHLGGKERSLYGGPLGPALGYLAAHDAIEEVVLTGGDPLSMADGWLERLMAALAKIPHLRVIRIHSRMATTLPARLTEALFDALDARGPHQQVVLVSHFNHPRELTAEATAALGLGRRRGVVLLNQSTLLRGVNDRVTDLLSLCQGLYRAGVTPYYLHHPDWTPGTFGFRVSIARGRALVGALAGRLSGPALPAYVLDVPPFGRGKVRLMEATVAPMRGAHNRGRDGKMEGQLYRVRLPHTRAGQGGRATYLDLAATRVDGALDAL